MGFTNVEPQEMINYTDMKCEMVTATYLEKVEHRRKGTDHHFHSRKVESRFYNLKVDQKQQIEIPTTDLKYQLQIEGYE